jgi:hypothetical protein
VEARELIYARQKIVTTATAFGLQAIDLVYIDYKSELACIYMQTRTHTRMDVRTLAWTHAHSHGCTHTRMHRRVRMHAHANVVHVHANVHANIHALIYSLWNAGRRPGIYLHINMHTSALTRTYNDAFFHTHACMHT